MFLISAASQQKNLLYLTKQEIKQIVGNWFLMN